MYLTSILEILYLHPNKSLIITINRFAGGAVFITVLFSHCNQRYEKILLRDVKRTAHVCR